MSKLEADIGKLIVSMNPYTDGSSGTMDPHTFIQAQAAAPDSSGMKDVWMEIDSYYPATWSFKGQEQKINTALRIAYRYKKKVGGNGSNGGSRDNGDNYVWVTDYLLIGYEGSGAG